MRWVRDLALEGAPARIANRFAFVCAVQTSLRGGMWLVREGIAKDWIPT